MTPQATATPSGQGSGDTGYYSFLDFPFMDVNGGAKVRVNLGNGNLLVQLQQYAIAGPGSSIDVQAVYNSFGNNTGPIFATNYGDAWSTNVTLQALEIQTGQVIFHGPSGEIGTFIGSGPTYSAPAGLNATLVKNTDGTYTLTYNRSGERINFSSTGLAKSRTDRNGTGVSYTSIGGDEITKVTDSTGKYVSFSIQTRPNTAKIRSLSDSAGRTVDSSTSSAYINPSSPGPHPALLPSLSGYRGDWSFTYDANNLLSSITHDNKSITFEYANGQITKVTQKKTGATDVVTQFAHSAGQTVVTDPNGGTSTYAVDSMYRVTSATDQLGHVRAQTWTPNSDIATTTDAMTTANTTTNSYDGSNNLTKTQLPSGAALQASYAAGTDCPNAQAGNPYSPKCTTDASGNKSSIEYDTVGNPTKQTDTTAAGGATTFQFTYETNGTLCGGKAGQVCTSTDANGHATSYSYSSGNLVKVTPPAPLGATTYGYDTLARLTSVKDGNGVTTTYGYDTLDRVTTITYADGSTLTSAYNSDGTTGSESDSARQVVKAYSYSLLNKISQQTQTSATTSYLTDTINYTYDAAGNQTSYSDAAGTVSYSFDAANRLTNLTEPGGSCPSSGTPAASSGCVLFQYDNNNSETARIFPGGARIDTTVDASGRPTRITSKNSASAVSTDIGYSYSAAGQTGTSADRSLTQTRTSYKEQGITGGAITSYTYDSAGRLTKAEEVAGGTVTASWTYGYDAAGNRTSQVKGGTTLTPANITYNYNAANEITSTSADTTTWTYDGAGNQTRNGMTGATATYNNRLAVTSLSGIGNATSFGTGNSVTLAGPTSGTKLLNAPGGIARVTTSTSASAYTRAPSGEVIAYRNGTTRQYLVADATGSTVGGFTASGASSYRYSYSPYGELRSYSGTGDGNSMRYISGYRVGTGASELYKLGARYYDPALGRFTQVDPSGQEGNPYAYSTNDPINRSDISGLMSLELAVSIVEALFLGNDVLSLLSADSDVDGLSAEFSIACGLIGSAIAAPTVAGALVVLGGCFIATELFRAALEESGVE